VVGPASTPLAVTIKAINKILENEQVSDSTAMALFITASTVSFQLVGNPDHLLVIR
jgi:spore maturation protein SpmA